MKLALLFGAVAIGSTLAGAYATTLLKSAKKTSVGVEEPSAVEFMKLEPVSVPVIRGGKIEGYVIARVSVAGTVADVKASKGILTSYATEAVFRAVYEEEALEFSTLKPVQVLSLGDRISRLANERMRRGAIKQTVIESLNFVSQAEIRSQQGRSAE